MVLGFWNRCGLEVLQAVEHSVNPEMFDPFTDWIARQ